MLRAIWAAVTAARIIGSDEDAQREEVLLGSGRQVPLVVVSRHRGQDTGLVPDRNVRLCEPTRCQTGQPRQEQDQAERGPARVAVGGAPVADRTSDATTAAASRVRAAIVAIDAAAGTARRSAKARIWRAKRSGPARPSSQVAAKSAAAGHLAHHPAEPEAIGSQPTSARAGGRGSHRNARRSGHA
jgi:hypothetical protein